MKTPVEAVICRLALVLEICDEEGEPEEGFDGRDVKFGFDALEARGVDCRTDVDRGREEADLECDEEFFGGGPIARVLGVVGGPLNQKVIGAFFLVDWDRPFLVCDGLWVWGFAIFLLSLLASNVE